MELTLDRRFPNHPRSTACSDWRRGGQRAMTASGAGWCPAAKPFQADDKIGLTGMPRAWTRPFDL